MKRKNAYKFGLSIIATLLLAACSGNNVVSSEKPVDSSIAPADTSSAAPVSSTPAPSSEASPSSEPVSSVPAPSSEPAPASSEQGPIGGSSLPDQSSVNPFNPGNSEWSFPSGDNSNSNPGPVNPQEPDFSVNAMKFEKANDGKVSLVLDGVVSDSFEGDFKWAWGIASGTTGAMGFGQATFIYGKAKADLLDEDYAAVTVDADKKFSVSLNIGDIVEGLNDFKPGVFTIYGGTPDSYGRINPPSDSSLDASTEKYHFYFGSNNIVVDAVIFQHDWSAQADGVNSDEKVIKNYSCECGAVAAGIAFTDCVADDVGNFDGDGKMAFSTTTHWKIVAPKAGECKLMMAAKLSPNYAQYNASNITFNTGYEIAAGDVAGTVTVSGKEYEHELGLNLTDFVYYEVGTLAVAKGENVISFTMPASQSYRLLQGGEVRLVFEPAE